MCKKFAIFSPPGMSFMSSLVMERSAMVDTRYTITATAMAASMHSAMRDDWENQEHSPLLRFLDGLRLGGAAHGHCDCNKRYRR